MGAGQNQMPQPWTWKHYFKHESNGISNLGKGRLRTNLHNKALLPQIGAATTIHFLSKERGTTKTTQKSSKISLVFTDSKKVPMQCHVESYSRRNKNWIQCGLMKLYFNPLQSGLFRIKVAIIRSNITQFWRKLSKIEATLNRHSTERQGQADRVKYGYQMRSSFPILSCIEFLNEFGFLCITQLDPSSTVLTLCTEEHWILSAVQGVSRSSTCRHFHLPGMPSWGCLSAFTPSEQWRLIKGVSALTQRTG